MFLRLVYADTGSFFHCITFYRKTLGKAIERDREKNEKLSKKYSTLITHYLPEKSYSAVNSRILHIFHIVIHTNHRTLLSQKQSKKLQKQLISKTLREESESAISHYVRTDVLFLNVFSASLTTIFTLHLQSGSAIICYVI